jgi:hypothetical protein
VLAKAASVGRKLTFSSALHFLSLAYNRKNAFKRAQRLRAKGAIVLLDRIPLEGITAMDCPRVHLVANGKYKKLIELEKKLYAKIHGVDALFVLKLNPEIALKRRLKMILTSCGYVLARFGIIIGTRHMVLRLIQTRIRAKKF